MKLNQKIIFIILLLALFIRLIPLDFPKFTADEARIAYRGYTLFSDGKDELGRSFPIIFNSLEDYQLPVVSYATALGLKLFGKTDFGARIPFVLLGTALVLLIYKIAQVFNPGKEFWLVSAAIMAFSPALIFLSKIPNEAILLTFIVTFLFYLMIEKRPNPILIFVFILLSILSSKFAWFIITPFVIVTLFLFPNNLPKKSKINISILCLLISLLTIMAFWQIPQAKRSLLENNFPIFSDITIKNGIDRLRGQGLEVTSQPFLEKVLFNKTHFLMVGFLHWLSQLGPATFFGQFDNSGLNGFINMGVLQKILIIPFAIGLVALIKKRDKKYMLLLIYPLLLTLPTLFIFPNLNFDLIVITLPFISLIITLGLFNISRLIRIFIIFLIVFEIGFNFFYLGLNIKSTNNFRPGWIKPIVVDGYTLSKEYKVGFSDDITSDIAPFIQWYTPISVEIGFLDDIPFPYKFRQTQLSNIKIIGSDNIFYKCGLDKPTHIFASIRDLENIVRTEKVEIKRTYKDSLGQDIAFLLPSTICVR